MAKTKTEIHVTTVFDGELDAADVFVSLLDSELRETQTANYFSAFQIIDRAVWKLMAD